MKRKSIQRSTGVYLDTLLSIHGAIYADKQDTIPMSGFIVPDQYFNILQDTIFAEATGNGLQALRKLMVSYA
ncbi:hypothetical protein CS542_05100 [Pedobacter sp. IW39]|nr:hypothetical protein CS542_05100 [Pedobacter sp. IW39]